MQTWMMKIMNSQIISILLTIVQEATDWIYILKNGNKTLFVKTETLQSRKMCNIIMQIDFIGQ